MSFVARNPALFPLFAAVGAGMAGAGWYGYHTLRHNQDVIIDKLNKPDPWNHITQDRQTKLYTPQENKAFWEARRGLASPSDAYKTAKAKVAEIKDSITGASH